MTRTAFAESNRSLRIPLVLLLLTTVFAAGGSSLWADSPFDEDVIVYTANQGWLSRIYILDMEGQVITYFEYDFFRFCDLEVVDGEIYAAEAFAPRGERFDPVSGELEVVIDDWSLYYFYDLAFDGSYFYVTEWDLNRYDIDGVKDGTASFDHDVYGSAWDGQFYWTLTDEGLIRCWDLSGWPALSEIVLNTFAPPSPDCRGLYYDGEYFWTAESKEDVLGYIYKFDRDGQVIDQWLEPAFQGWGVCVLEAAPSTVTAELACEPAMGTLPFVTQMTATLTNNYPDQLRRMAARIDLTLAGGGYYTNWRSGFTTIGPGDSFVRFWNQSLPALATLVGDNTFQLVAADVTPSPYNQPPYPPAGDIDSDSCTVSAVAP